VKALSGSIKNQLLPLEHKKPCIINTGDEILDAILPPRDLGYGYVQYVSRAKATRFDLKAFTTEFDQNLEVRNARKTGICPVRADLYKQCFDEIIRQVTVDCPERGLLLLRLRDELKMTTNAYRTLYNVSIDFGLKQTVEAERGMPEMYSTIASLSQERDSLLKQVQQLEIKRASMLKCVAEQVAADKKKHAEEISFLTRTKERLQKQVNTIRAIQKKERDNLLSGLGAAAGNGAAVDDPKGDKDKALDKGGAATGSKDRDEKG